MTDDIGFPRLTPPDDKFQGSDRLHRKPEELTDEQFDLLAAAWAGDALEAGSLADLESAIEALPSRRMRAESFRSVKLIPYNDRWIYRDRLLRQSPATAVIRRSLALALLSAAAVIAFILFWPSTSRQATGTLPGTLPGNSAISEALIPEASPIIIQGAGKETPASEVADLNTEMPLSALNNDATVSGPATETTREAMTVTNIEAAEAAMPILLTSDYTAETSLVIAAAEYTNLRPVEMKSVTAPQADAPGPAEVPSTEKETGWLFRGISAMAKAITGEEKKIDGYVVASACVNGINNFLGWDMELKQASTPSGEPLAVNFTSSLISVTAPVNKNSP